MLYLLTEYRLSHTNWHVVSCRLSDSHDSMHRCIATLCLHMLYSLYNSSNLILCVYTAVKSVESNNVLSGYKLWRT